MPEGSGMEEQMPRRTFLGRAGKAVIGAGLALLGLSTVRCAPAKGTQTPESTPAPLPTPTEYPSAPNPEKVRLEAYKNELWGRLKKFEQNSPYKFTELNVEKNKTLYWLIDTGSNTVGTDRRQGMSVRSLPIAPENPLDDKTGTKTGDLNNLAVTRGQYVISLTTKIGEGEPEPSRWLVFQREDVEGNGQDDEQLTLVIPEHSNPSPSCIKSKVNGQNFYVVCISKGDAVFLRPTNIGTGDIKDNVKP